VKTNDYLDYIQEAGKTEQPEQSIEELLKIRLRALGADEDEISEAEQLAISAAEPTKDNQGQIRGSVTKLRPLTTQQMAFVENVIQGKTRRQAYRDAYPNNKGSDASVSACAYRLARDPRIARLIETGWSETVEALAEDRAATTRYVMRQLVGLSKAARQEGSRLKALELLGRASGLWRENTQSKDEPVSPDQLKRELASHLKLVSRKKAG
jgi:hypothetical protein